MFTSAALTAAVLILVLVALALVGWVDRTTSAPGRLGKLHEGSASDTNIVYVKVLKTGSSTVSGALRRVCVKHGLSGCRSSVWIRQEPGLWARHGPFDATFSDAVRRRFASNYGSLEQPQQPDLRVLTRLSRPVFLLTVVRHPAERCLSQLYYFHRGRPLTNATKLAALRRCTDFSARYLRPASDASAPPSSAAARVLHAYDLVGTTERLDETLVLVAAALCVPLAHVLTVTAKNSSLPRSDPETGRVSPHRLPLEQEAGPVRAYARGAEFARRNEQDFALWREANVRIAERFERSASLREALQAYRRLQLQAARACAIRYTVSRIDKQVECYFHDQGCNYKCLDALFESADQAGLRSSASTSGTATSSAHRDALLVPSFTNSSS